jgi:hypothetical protein
MRLILPVASAYSAIRGIMSRSMSSFDHSASEPCIRSFLREIYERTSPRNIMSVFVTGGGSTSIQWLFTVPGASRSLMDAGVVYSRSAVESFIKDHPHDASESSCSSVMATVMADASWRQANKLLLAECRDFNDLRDARIFGISCSASLRSDSPKKGAHRVFVAFTTQELSNVYSIEFEKGRRSREDEDAACSRLILEAIALASEAEPLAADYLFPKESKFTFNPPTSHFDAAVETVVSSSVKRCDILERIYRKDVHQALFVRKASHSEALDISDDGTDVSLSRDFVIMEDVPLPKGTLVFPGSFNPLHEGHVALVVAALQKISTCNPSVTPPKTTMSGSPNCSEKSRSTDSDSVESWKRIPVVFEIAAINADKPPLPREEILRRIQQFDHFLNPALKAAGLTNFAVCVTSEPLFLQKSKLFLDCNFLIGSDTMSRIINPKYYGGDQLAEQRADELPAGEREAELLRLQQQRAYAMVSALTIIMERNCRFIVGGRVADQLGSSEERFVTLQNAFDSSAVGLPSSLRASLFEGLTEDEFRVDLSSTEIRKRGF